MRLPTLSLSAFLAFQLAKGLIAPALTSRRCSQHTARTTLQSLAAPIPPSEEKGVSAPSAGGGEDSVSSGKILEGGKIIDFEAVKGPSSAEQALLKAKEDLLRNDQAVSTSPSGILGINEEVIAEVGHDLATFASTEDIQGCATYLRSKSPPGLLESRTTFGDAAPSFVNGEIARYETMLEKAYAEAGEVTSAFAKTFYMGTQLLSDGPRKAIWAVYVWCRRTDEIVDAPRDNDEEMLRDLASWEMRLENLFKYGEVEDVFDLCLLDVLVKYPSLPITPFMDMIRGMLMDVPELGQDRYDTFDELHLYCYRVAGTVGLMSLPIFGCSPGYDEFTAKEPALSLGVAFQLTNILRDVGEDAVQRGRVYLPREDMARFGVTEEQIYAQRINENYIEMMKFQIARARMYYERARRGVFMLAPESRLPVQASLDAYGEILQKIEENGYNSLTTRAYVGKLEKLCIIPFSWYRTLDVSREMPLPGDKPVPELNV